MKIKTIFSTSGGAFFLLVTIIFLISCSGGSGSNNEFDDFSLEDINNDDLTYIEGFHAEYFPIANLDEPKDNPAVYVDFSDGITKYSLNNDNNKEVFKMLFKVFAVEETTEYFELHSDKLIPYIGSSHMSHFSEDGHKDAKGDWLIGAPIDKAINAIVERDNVGVLITDGELYDEGAGKVSQETWASKAFEKWMNKGNELAIVYTDFDEQNEGVTYDKHMYVMFFIPSGENQILDNYLESLESEGYKPKVERFSTNTNGLYNRDNYPNSETPGSSKAIEYEALNEDMSGKTMFLAAENSAMEFIDFTALGLSFDEGSGLIYFVRDLGDENTGKPMSYPLLEKLYFKFSSLPNYKVNNLKIVVHDVFDDFKSYKVNQIVRNNLPVIEKATDGSDSLNDDNYLVFKGMPTLDGEEPYDTSKVTVDKIENDFLSMLKSEYKFNPSEFSSSSKGIQDFLMLDQSAGKISEVNDDGEYEIIVKFSDLLNEKNSQLSSERYNLVRVDVIIDKVELKDINKQALTWTRIDDGKTDDALYRSLINIMKKSDIKPQGVVYSYYLKFNAYNQ
ncbi:hypothetical protein OAD28_01295 [Flavobacteriales bacterium]|nr:hypothetical protein [Flavobacteriales bacterium]